MEGDYAIASFRSRQQVMNFESQLRSAGVHGEVVSTPREIAVGCGLSVKFAYADFPRVRDMCGKSPPANMIGIYRADNRPGSRARFMPIMGSRGW